MTAFKASRLAQILMAPTVALVRMDIWATGGHSAVGITGASNGQNGGVMDYS